MIIFLATSILTKKIGAHVRKLSPKYIWVGYASNFIVNTLFGIFPAGGGILFHVLYTFGFGMTTLQAKTMTKLLGFALIPGLLIPLVSSGMYNITYILSYAFG
jgi:hypothetical protein